MAMSKCRECGREVSTSAATCPGCGVKAPVKRTSAAAWIGLVVVLFLAVRACTKSSPKPADASGADAPVAAAALAANPTPAGAPAAPAAPLPPLAAATLLQAYKANEVSADLKYKGKRFHVTGTVVGIRSDFTDDPVVELVTGMMGVSATGLSKQFAATLNKGDTLESDCTVRGSVVGSPMLDCSR